MTKRQVFYSFHFGNDVMRVQQVRNIRAIEENTPVAPNAWEQVKAKGDKGIKEWIEDNMKYRSCVVVLIGTETHKRPWVKYEIEKAWIDGKGLLGIHIHNLKCPNNGICSKGDNPFDQFAPFKVGGTVVVPSVYNPPANDAYNHISTNMASWVESAIAQRG